MEQAQLGVLEMDLFIASLQPMRWIKSLAGVHAPAGGAHYQHGIIGSSRDILDKLLFEHQRRYAASREAATAGFAKARSRE